MVEEVWASYERRQKRRMKYEMALAEITGAATWGTTTAAEAPKTNPPKKTFETPPTDADNWDASEAELDLMAASGFPIQIVRGGTHPN